MKPAQPIEFTSLKFDRVSFGYDSHAPILNDLTIDLPLNSGVFVTGQGGSGLSTLLKLIAVMLHPTEGKFFLNGHDTGDMTFEDFLPYRMQIGYSFDIGGLFANRTIKENLTLPMLYHRRYTPDEAAAIADGLAVEYGFAGQKDQRPAMVSGGLRKLTCVLRALILRPQMLVLDDPFSGIGMDASRTLVRTIQQRRESGELKHFFITSRDELWPQWMGCHNLYIESGALRFEEKAVAS